MCRPQPCLCLTEPSRLHQGLNWGLCHCPKLGVRPWGNARWEEHLFDCKKCLEMAFKCFRSGLYEIQDFPA